MHRLKKLLSYIITLKVRYVLYRKINKIRKIIELSSITNEIIYKNKTLWKKIDRYYSPKWLIVYQSINKINDFRYVSEITYYTMVEPCLNNVSFSEAYSDKNFYSLIVEENILPDTIVRCIDGVYYQRNFKQLKNVDENISSLLSDEVKFICKKSTETGGGRSVTVFNRDNLPVNLKASPSSFFRENFGKNFIVQEYINQHHFFKEFNASSVNTVRIFTYRSVVNNEVLIIQAVLRIGQEGALVDNQASGGISCGLNIDNGSLNKFAVDKYGLKYFKSSGIEFKDKQIPYFEKMKQIAKEVATRYVYHRLLGFDFAVDAKEHVKLIEVNSKNHEINFYQMNNGPLFGDFTEEIIDYCSKNQRSFCLDFEI